MLNRIWKGRGPVEFRDRRPKAQMIEAILQDFLAASVSGFRVLDIGCGNGGISRYFAEKNRVDGVDTKDRRTARTEPFEFTLVDSERLPFSSGSFDIVLSHHVIEHVDDQRLHLAEVRRVLREGGVCYMATPNRSSPIMRGHVGNQQVLRHAAMRPLFESAGFKVHEYSARVLTQPDVFRYPLRFGALLPLWLAERLSRVYPSSMFVLEPSGTAVSRA